MMALIKDDSIRSGEIPQRRRGLSTFKLKVIGAFFMTLSAAMGTFGTAMLNSDKLGGLTGLVLFELISWVAIPIYAWLLFEGFHRTRSVGKYAGRLFLLAAVTEIPYDLSTTGKVFDMSSQNPIWGLLIGLVVLVMIRWARESGGVRYAILAAVILAAVLWDLLLRIGSRQVIMNIGVVTIGFLLIFTFLQRYENTMMMTAGLFGAAALITPGIGVAFLHYRNGELGYLHTWTRWVFYAYYPLICVILWLVF
ncbi:TraX family protein [Arcanobacterium canis]|uniref:TraX family protein n=1 Tax=Arcanobacterium canis TaxID=999183 RepID=A0ABY8G149_9ACTO|nr:TraX family protein [Arcanobacterium canis]WFM83021.1 TraX family protein [Arcanobacterium canis]